MIMQRQIMQQAWLIYLGVSLTAELSTAVPIWPTANSQLNALLQTKKSQNIYIYIYIYMCV